MTFKRQTMSETECAICGDTASSAEIYPAAVAADGVLMRGRIVRCDRCGLMRTDPAADASFTHPREAAALRNAYRRALQRVLQLGAGTSALLDVGDGSLLEHARAAAFARVTGVAATLHAGMFPDATFDVVCLSGVLDRIADPRACLYASVDVLKPGGYLLAMTDNVDGVFTRLLGRRSPIFDAAHTFFYSPKTLATLARRTGLDVVSARSAAKIVPLSPRLSLPLPLGSLQLIGRKPGRLQR